MRKTIIVAFLLLWSRIAGAQGTSDPQKWRDDLGTLTTSLPALHPNFYFQVSRDAFQSAASALNQQIPEMSDSQIVVKMAELIAMAGDAHTNLNLTQTAAGLRTLPIRVQWFDDGLFVVAALPGAEAAIGKRITRIGGRDIQDAYNKVVPLISAENDVWRLRMSQDYLVVPEILAATGVTPTSDAAEFEFEDASSTTLKLQLAASRIVDARNWIYVPDLTTAAVPLYRKQNNQNYWFQYLGDSKTLYFKYNACVNAAGLTFPAFTAEFLRAVDGYPIERFVFDFRNNGGGDSSLIQPLIAGLQQRYNSGRLGQARLFLIIGRETFSSALLNALDLKQAPLTTLVGEPTGGKPNHYGNVGTLTLPRTGLRISYSTRFFSSPVMTSSLNPDIPVSFPSGAFFQNRDPFLEAIAETQPASTAATSFVMYNGGGSRFQSGGQTAGQTGEARVAYGIVTSPSDIPFGFAVIQSRRGEVLVSEATFAASNPISSGITYAEVDERVDTGVALANTAVNDAVIEFTVTNDAGQTVKSGSFSLPAGQQIARFLHEAPFSIEKLAGGALRLTSSVPVSVLALRGYNNERGEFLLSTLSFIEASATTSPVYCAHFADGEGWTTQINLVNPTATTISGSFEFVPGERFTYVLPPNSARRFRTQGTGALRTGFVRITPDAGSIAASATALFSLKRGGIIVTEASVDAKPAAASQTLLVSGSGGFLVGAPNAVMSGIGVANPGADIATVQLSIVSLAGSVLATTSVQIQPGAQRALFADQLFAGNITLPFEGTMRIASSGATAVTGLRGQYNQRGDFIISATPVFEDSPGNVFTHVVDGGGYSTRFFFLARNGSGGALRFIGPNGLPLSFDLR